jgi:hypothetical protein
MISIYEEDLDRLRDQLITALSPPWWEKWAILIAFTIGLVVGYVIGGWYFP